MKKIILNILAIIIICFNLTAQTRIAVLPFTADERMSKSAMAYLTEIFTVEMVNSRKFTVVERAKLDAALKEMQFQNGDMFDESTAVELGKMSGAEMVFFGNIFRFGRKEMMSIKGMDIRTATLKYAKQEQGGSDTKLEIAVKKIADQIIHENDETELVSESVKQVKKESVVKQVKKESASEPEEKTSYQSERQTTDNIEKETENQQRQSAQTQKITRPNKKSDGYTGSRELTIPEEKVLDKYIEGKWNISANSKSDMTYYYKNQIATGIALAAVGSTILLSGIIVTSVLCSQKYENKQYHDQYDSNGNYSYTYYTYDTGPAYFCIMLGGVIGGNLMAAGIIISACCAYPFILAQRIASIYAKTSGNKLAFLERTNFDCGYDCVNKEIKVAMAIKL